jgi:hypothetical protein
MLAPLAAASEPLCWSLLSKRGNRRSEVFMMVQGATGGSFQNGRPNPNLEFFFSGTYESAGCCLSTPGDTSATLRRPVICTIWTRKYTGISGRSAPFTIVFA